MIAGITGHRHLTAEVASWVEKSLASILIGYDVAEGYSSLAVGADQIFAEALLARKIRLNIVLPSENYEQTFTAAELPKFSILRNRAAKEVTLPFAEPSEEAYMAAGKFIVDASGVLFAVWDGAPARGLGGTADVVNYARSKNVHVVHINPSTLTVD